MRSWCSCFPRGCGCRSWRWADSATPARPSATAAPTPFAPSIEPLVISNLLHATRKVHGAAAGKRKEQGEFEGASAAEEQPHLGQVSLWPLQ